MLRNGTRLCRWSLTIGHSHAPDKKQAFLNLTLYPKNPMPELLVRELFVCLILLIVARLVPRTFARSESDMEPFSRVIESTRLTRTGSSLTGLTCGLPGIERGFFSSMHFFTRLMSSAPQLNRFLHSLTLI